MMGCWLYWWWWIRVLTRETRERRTRRLMKVCVMVCVMNRLWFVLRVFVCLVVWFVVVWCMIVIRIRG